MYPSFFLKLIIVSQILNAKTVNNKNMNKQLPLTNRCTVDVKKISPIVPVISQINTNKRNKNSSKSIFF